MSSAAAEEQSFRALPCCLWLSVGSLSGRCSSPLVSRQVALDCLQTGKQVSAPAQLNTWSLWSSSAVCSFICMFFFFNYLLIKPPNWVQMNQRVDLCHSKLLVCFWESVTPYQHGWSRGDAAEACQRSHYSSPRHLWSQASTCEGSDPSSGSKGSVGEGTHVKAELVRRSSNHDDHEKKSSVSASVSTQEKGTQEPTGSLCGLFGPRFGGS